jgi:Tfp pilus assembly protein PilF
MGNVYQELDMPDKGLESYRKALEIDPNYDEAIYNSGNLCQKTGDFNQAVTNYQKSLAINPHRADAYSNLGLAFMKLGKSEDAITALRQAVSIAPGEAEYHFNLGNAFSVGDRFGEAIGCYQTAIGISPGYIDAMINMGNALQGSRQFDEALAVFHQAIDCDPRSFIACNNLGKAYQDQGDYQKAKGFYLRAMEINPGYAEAHFNHAFVLLMMGDFAEGWKEYEWRFKRGAWEKTYPHRLPGSRWDGSNFAGKRLLIHCEQGYGDLFQFVRYLSMVKNRGGTVILEVMRSAKGLLENHPAVDELVVFSTDRPPGIEYDLYIPLLSLPGLFGTDSKSIPAGVPYLHADPRKSTYWSKQLSGSHFRVGIVWSGSATDPNRSCALSCFSSLAEIEGIRLYGLQKGPAALQAEQLSGDIQVANLENESGDFSDTAGAIENLDLVISIDTSVAHLAGAMGKPVWVLLPFACDWRWQPDGESSPWYPTMKLYRQARPGDWQSVCKRVAADLAAKLANRQIANGRYTDHHNTESESAHQQAVSAYRLEISG